MQYLMQFEECKSDKYTGICQQELRIVREENKRYYLNYDEDTCYEL